MVYFPHMLISSVTSTWAIFGTPKCCFFLLRFFFGKMSKYFLSQNFSVRVCMLKIPRFFGVRKRDTPCQLTSSQGETPESYFGAIKNEINRRLLGNQPLTKRAVLVFFDTKATLGEFCPADDFKSYSRFHIYWAHIHTYTYIGSSPLGSFPLPPPK